MTPTQTPERPTARLDEAYRCRHCGLDIRTHSDARIRECSDALSLVPAVREEDAPPLPEIRAEDVAWAREGIVMLTETAQQRALSDREQVVHRRLERILAVLEAVSARKGGGNG